MKKTVTIPARAEHQGFYSIDVTLNWVCPICGKPRGEVYKGLSYDGSLRLSVDCWNNPCGHIDSYKAVREEAKKAVFENTKPILFSTPMVQAILAGRKTQTRRIIKPQPPSEMPQDFSLCIMPMPWKEKDVYYFSTITQKPFKQTKWQESYLPHRKGDILYVRETWQGFKGNLGVEYGYNNQNGIDYIYKADDPTNLNDKWRPSLFMPKAAARIFLEITNVRAERLQDISPYECKLEGVSIPASIPEDGADLDFAKTEFIKLWNKLNSKRGYGWETNPFVWVYEFQRVEVAE